ncbi:MAG: ferredoxin family protein [bacterium]
MVKRKLYNRINRMDKSAVLPLLTSVEDKAVGLHSLNKANKRAKQESRGWVEITADLCKGCLLCLEACPPDVLKASESLNKMGYHPAEYVGEGCTACGICFYICPEPGTIRVYKRIRVIEEA